MNEIDAEIFLIRCPHETRLSLELNFWCNECKDWIDGVDVGDFTIKWDRETGDIKVSGGGYVPHSYVSRGGIA